MKERFKLSLSGLWLLVSIFSLLLPVFMPSSANASNFAENAIGTASVSMFILSVPSSLFGLPAMFFAGTVLGVNPNSIEGMYLNLFLLFVFGLAQWLWIVPRVLRNEPRFQILNLFGGKTEIQLLKAKTANNIPFCDSDGRTPIERVFEEKDAK
jgi:hypothetical protein